MGRNELGAYTLLADENSRFSKAPELKSAFRAHVVFNILTQGGLTFSDNQVMSSPNLRILLRGDGVIRQLVKENQILVAVRDPDGIGPKPLDQVFEDFRVEGKIPVGLEQIGDSPEITFMETECSKIGWDYTSVRNTFTVDCERVVLEQARSSWGDTDYDFLESAIREEAATNSGLGRIFLQVHLPEMLEKERIMAKEKAFAFLTRCTDAVYLSNLPKTIGLSPIYADEHRESFQLLRGGNYQLKDFGDPVDLKPRLNHEHFTHGLNELDIDDINAIQATRTYRDYRRFSEARGSVEDFEALFVLYKELNREIEDRIIQRFRSLLIHSPAPDPRKLQRQYGSWVSKGAARFMDVLSIASIMPSVSGVVLGWATNIVVDMVNKKINPERRHADAAMHELEKGRLETYLRAHGKGETISFEKNVKASDSFDEEIIVS